MAEESTHSVSENRTSPQTTQLLPPSDVVTLFMLDLLAVTLVVSVILGSFYFLETRFSDFFVTPPRPIELLVGNGILLWITAALLSVSVVAALTNVRFLVAVESYYLREAVIGLVLTLLSGIVVALTLFQFYSDPTRFSSQLIVYLAVQIVVALVTIYYSALLKSELLEAIYEHTTWVGILKMRELNQAGRSSDVERNLIESIRNKRQSELQILRSELDVHKSHLINAGNSSEQASN